MYNIKIFTRAYFSLIKLVDSYTSADWKTLSNLYYLTKFVRSAICDFPQYVVCLDEFKSVLNICAARLKKRVGNRSNHYIIEETTIGGSTNYDKDKSKELHSPLTNSYGAIIYFIRKALKDKKVGDFLMLYNIADLYMQHLFVYSDMIDENPNIDNSGEINVSLRVIISGMGYYIGLLESAMRTEGIKFDEIKV